MSKGKTLANVIVAVNWILLAISTVAVVAILGFVLGYADATNSYIRSYTSVFNEKTDEQGLDSDHITEQDLKRQTDLVIFYGMVIGVCLLLQALLNTLLTVGVRKADHRKLNIWLVIHMIILFLSIYSFIRDVYTGKLSAANDVMAKLGALFWILGSLLAIKYYRDGLDVSTSTTTSGISFVTSEKIPYMKV